MVEEHGSDGAMTDDRAVYERVEARARKFAAFENTEADGEIPGRPMLRALVGEIDRLREALEEARARANYGCQQCWDVVTAVDLALGKAVDAGPTVDRSGVSSDDVLVEDGRLESADAKALRERGFKRINKPKRLTPPRP